MALKHTKRNIYMDIKNGVTFQELMKEEEYNNNIT